MNYLNLSSAYTNNKCQIKTERQYLHYLKKPLRSKGILMYWHILNFRREIVFNKFVCKMRETSLNLKNTFQTLWDRNNGRFRVFYFNRYVVWLDRGTLFVYKAEIHYYRDLPIRMAQQDCKAHLHLREGKVRVIRKIIPFPQSI